MSSAFDTLVADLERTFAGGVDAPLDDEAFGRLALRVLEHQVEANPTYRAFCEGRGLGPGAPARWEDAPAVPARAFRHVDLQSAEGAPEATFLTSGTTGQGGVRGRHPVPRLSLYRGSLRPAFQAHLLPEGRALPLLSLVPSPDEAPHSSLSTMVGDVAGHFASSVVWLAHPDAGVDVAAFRSAAADVVDRGEPALVAGTAFAFVHLLDALATEGLRIRLPEGTRIVETGGFKGRSRAVARDDLYAEIEARLGVPAARVVNEYGMTELLSQLYEPVLRVGPGARGLHVPPPWLRVRALDPDTLEPLPPGRPGLLAFFDLANAGSVAHVLTEDLGTVSADGVRLRGRSPGAEPRGCSLALEEILDARGSRR